MDDFGKFIYLDVHKTGSTYVSDFLQRHSNQTRQRFAKHRKPGSRIRKDTIAFISVRHPFSQYRSLFQYGCDGRGALFGSLRRKGLADLYGPSPENFEAWLNFVLDPKNSFHLQGRYRNVNTSVVGYQTYRFLSLGMKRAHKGMKNVSSRRALKRMLGQRKTYSHVLRTETLNEDLLSLIETSLTDYFDDMDAVRSELTALRPVVNTSTKQSLTEADLKPRLRARLRRRESLLFDKFYPDT